LTINDVNDVLVNDTNAYLTASPGDFPNPPNVDTHSITVTLGIGGTGANNYDLQTASLSVDATITTAAFVGTNTPYVQGIQTGGVRTPSIDLSLLHPTPNFGSLGTVSYSMAAYSPGVVGDAAVLNPTVNPTHLNITSKNLASGFSTTEDITVSLLTQNFGSISVTVRLTPNDKTSVNIGGLSALNQQFLSGTPRLGYSGTATFTLTSGGTSVTPVNQTLTASYTERSGSTTPSYGPTDVAPTNAGEYTVSLTLANDDTYTGTISFNFEITKIDQAALTFNPTTPVLYATGLSIPLSASGGTAGAYSYSVESGPGTIAPSGTDLTVSGVGSIVVRAIRAGDNNYNPVTLDRTIVVNRGNPIVNVPTGLTAYYGQMLSAIVLPDSTTGTIGSFEWATATPGTTPVGNVGSPTHQVRFTPNDTANFVTPAGTYTVSIAVTGAEIPAATINAVVPVTGNAPSNTATIVSGANFSVNSVVWVGTPTFFAPATTYTVDVVLRANTNYAFASGSGFTATGNAAATSTTVTDNTGDTVTIRIAFPATAAATVPSEPVIVSATPNSGQVTLSWSPPLSNGGTVILGYQVSLDDTTWEAADSNTGHVFDGLDNGTSYTFYVRAQNAQGFGPSANRAATPNAPAPPPPPPEHTAPGGEDGSVKVPYKPSDDGSNVTLVIDKPVLDELINSATNNTVRINLDTADTQDVTEATIPTAAIAGIVAANPELGFQLDLPQGTIILDATATEALASQSGGVTISLSLFEQMPADLSDQQNNANTLQTGDMIFSITASSNGVPIENFNFGWLTIIIPYDGPLPATVYYMNAAGVLEAMPTEYDAAIGSIIFRTQHLSTYIIRHTPGGGGAGGAGSGSGTAVGSSRSPQTGDYSNTSLWQLVLLASVLSIVSAFIVRNYIIKKKKWESMVAEYKDFKDGY